MYRPFRQNHIFISLLDISVFIVTLGDEILSLLFKSKVICARILIDDYIN